MRFLPSIESRSLSTPLQLLLPHFLLLIYLIFPSIPQLLSRLPFNSGKILFGSILVVGHSINFHIFTTIGGPPIADFGSASISWYHAAKAWSLVVLENPHEDARRIVVGGETRKERTGEEKMNKSKNEEKREEESSRDHGLSPLETQESDSQRLVEPKSTISSTSSQTKRLRLGEQLEPPSKTFDLFNRFKWSCDLMMTMRGFNFSFGQSHLRDLLEKSRVDFNPYGKDERSHWLRLELKRMLVEILLMDVINCYMQSREVFKPLWFVEANASEFEEERILRERERGVHLSPSLIESSLALISQSFPDMVLPPSFIQSSHFPYNVLNILSASSISYLSLSIIYRLLSISLVAIHLSRPESWYPLFGSISNAYSLRDFWNGSMVWHGCFRAVFLKISRWIMSFRFREEGSASSMDSFKETSQLGHSASTSQEKRPKSKVQQFIRIQIIFLLSAFLHMTGTFSMNRSWKGSLMFFGIQPLGIWVEEGLRRKGCFDQKFWGYVWVVSWCKFSALSI